jgi:hypothetical protein
MVPMPETLLAGAFRFVRGRLFLKPETLRRPLTLFFRVLLEAADFFFVPDTRTSLPALYSRDACFWAALKVIDGCDFLICFTRLEILTIAFPAMIIFSL